MRYRALSFDLHGSLLSPDPSIGGIYAEVAATHGIHVDVIELQASFVEHFHRIRTSWPVPYGADETDARDFWLAVIHATFAPFGPFATADGSLPVVIGYELFEQLGRGARWRVLPGVREALALGAARRLPMVVCTNFDRRALRIVAETGLGPFVQVLPSTEAGDPKPSPDLLHMAAVLLEIDPHRILHLGDNIREDGGACRAAGMPLMQLAPHRGIDHQRLAAILDGREDPDWEPAP